MSWNTISNKLELRRVEKDNKPDLQKYANWAIQDAAYYQVASETSSSISWRKQSRIIALEFLAEAQIYAQLYASENKATNVGE